MVHRGTETHVWLGQTGTGHHQYDGFVYGEIELAQLILAFVIGIETGSDGDARYADL